MVLLLSLASLTDEITAAYKARNRQSDVDTTAEKFTACDTLGSQGVVRTARGFIGINSEGVIDAKPVSDENPLEINLYVSHKGGCQMFPWTSIKFVPDQIENLISGDPVPLHEFVRSFGSRLESNYYICEDHLNRMNRPVRKLKVSA
jgi:hypothetical protein